MNAGKRILSTDFDQWGGLSIGIDDLSCSQTTFALTMGFGEGRFDFQEMRVECESPAAREEFLAIIREAGEYDRSEHFDPAASKLYRTGYEVYDRPGLVGVFIFVNPEANPALFAMHDVQGLTAEDLSSLFPAAPRRKLSVGIMRIEEEGMWAISELEGLQALHFAGTIISDAGLQHLAALKDLSVLYLRNTPVSKSGIDQLQSKLPGCEIIAGSDSEPGRTSAQ